LSKKSPSDPQLRTEKPANRIGRKRCRRTLLGRPFAEDARSSGMARNVNAQFLQTMVSQTFSSKYRFG